MTFDEAGWQRDLAQFIAKQRSRQRVHARCEQCHRIVLLPAGEEKLINPDWWFCEECRGEGSTEYDEESW
jgi:uncharacterized protein with PIN domain